LSVAASPSASWVTASPSIIQPGTMPLGKNTLPNTWFTSPGNPSTVSMCRTWTYSCSTMASSHSRSSASSEVAAGGTP
jgi:hypothetical protein